MAVQKGDLQVPLLIIVQEDSLDSSPGALDMLITGNFQEGGMVPVRRAG